MPSRLLCCVTALAGLLGPPLHATADEAKKGKKYALLVGVKEYDHADLNNLKHTENDVEELAKLLDRGSGFAEVVVLTTARGEKRDADRPTAANFRRQLKRLLGKVTKHDLILVGLAGHGLQIRVEDPGTKKERDESFFCPSDAGPKKTTDLAELKKTMIPLIELFKNLDESGAGVKLLLVDACRNDLKGARGRNMNTDSVPPPPRGTAALFSCKGGEQAFETERLGKGHGVFFYHVIEAMKGKARNDKGEILWSRLVDFVVEGVSEVVPALIGGGARQTPQEIKNIIGRSPVLLGDAAGDPAEAEGFYRRGADHFFGVKGDVDVKEAARWFARAAEKGHPLGALGLAYLTSFGLGVEPDFERAVKLARAALPKVRKLAGDGDVAATNWLGVMCREGIGVELDEEEAVKHFRKAAAGGDLDAMDNLGGAYQGGRGVARGEEEAVRWYRKAAAKGLPASLFNLGQMYLYGQGVEKDEKEGIRLIRKAAEKNDPGAMISLGACYYSGTGVEKDEDAAVRWFRKAESVGHPGAMLSLGYAHLDGKGVRKDDAAALRLFRKAAERRLAAAMTAVGGMYEVGRAVSRDVREAAKWYRKGADLGDLEATEQLGTLIEAGAGGLRQDAKEAFKLYKKAADRGLVSAIGRVGRCYARGVGVERDDEEAVRWMKKAADRDDARSLHELGFMYDEGRGVEKDEQRAAQLYRRSAAKGVVMSLYNLGNLYLDGRGVEQSDAEAFKYYKQSAEKGLANGQYALAALYEEGRGTKANRRQALAWYRKAAGQGHGEAKKKVRELEGDDA